MTTVELPPEWAFTRDRSSGRDEVTAEQVSDADPDKLCKRCFRTGIEGVPA